MSEPVTAFDWPRQQITAIQTPDYLPIWPTPVGDPIYAGGITSKEAEVQRAEKKQGVSGLELTTKATGAVIDATGAFLSTSKAISSYVDEMYRTWSTPQASYRQGPADVGKYPVIVTHSDWGALSQKIDKVKTVAAGWGEQIKGMFSIMFPKEGQVSGGKVSATTTFQLSGGMAIAALILLYLLSRD